MSSEEIFNHNTVINSFPTAAAAAATTKPLTEVSCVRCGEYACWTGSRSLSEEQVQQWWDQRSHAAQENGYEGSTVICMVCEALFSGDHNDNTTNKTNSNYSNSDGDDQTISEDEHCSENLEHDKKIVKTKRLILIRHAESENNVDKREAKLAFNNLKTMQSLPTFSQVRWLSNNCLALSMTFYLALNMLVTVALYVALLSWKITHHSNEHRSL